MAAGFLLHRLSLADDEAELLPTTAEALRAAPFIDGRSDFSSGSAIRLALADFAAREDRPAAEDRYIFHIAFCGSTLLARLLDVPGQVLVLREPNCLADLANQRAAADRAGKALPAMGEILGSVRRHLARPWRVGEAVIVKPSNWVNNLLPDFVPGRALHPLFLISSRTSYLQAVFRGGPARLAFAARAAVHLSSADENDARDVSTALAADDDRIGQLARLAVTTRQIQLRQFRAAAKRGGWHEDHWLDYAELARNPMLAAAKATAALDIGLSADALAVNVARWADRNAKNPDALFSSQDEAEAAKTIAEEHGGAIRSALDWAAGAFGDQD